MEHTVTQGCRTSNGKPESRAGTHQLDLDEEALCAGGVLPKTTHACVCDILYWLTHGRRPLIKFQYPLPDETNAVPSSPRHLARGSPYLGILHEGLLKDGVYSPFHSGGRHVGVPLALLLEVDATHAARIAACLEHVICIGLTFACMWAAKEVSARLR